MWLSVSESGSASSLPLSCCCVACLCVCCLDRHITTLPAVPGLPPHQSLRPYMVYEMEQIRQLGRKYEEEGAYSAWGAGFEEKNCYS